MTVTEQWQSILEEIKKQYAEGTKEAISDAAKKGARLLRQISPRGSGSRSGKYARGWTSSVENDGVVSVNAYIYNKTDWQLTHLLEKGHDIKNRFGGPFGHYDGVHHILDAENEVFNIIMKELPVRVSRGLY